MTESSQIGPVDGTQINVRVRENEDSGDEGTDYAVMPQDGNDLVAERSGIIESMIVRKGIPLVKKGDTVEKGQILVSGAVPVVGDDGETTGYQYQKADADIRARTILEYEDTENVQYPEKIYYDFQQAEPYLQIGNLYLNSGKSDKISDQAEIYTLKRTSFGEHFSIPVRIGSRVGRYYYIEQKHNGRKDYKDT